MSLDTYAIGIDLPLRDLLELLPANAFGGGEEKAIGLYTALLCERWAQV